MITFLINNCSNVSFYDLKVCNYDKIDNPSYSIISRMTEIKYLGLMFGYDARWNILCMYIIYIQHYNSTKGNYV